MTTIGSVGTGLTGNLARPASDGRFDPGEGVPAGRDELTARLAEAKRYRDL